MGANPEMNKAEEEQVRQDVVASNVRGCAYIDGLRAVERPCIDELENENEYPSKGVSEISKLG